MSHSSPGTAGAAGAVPRVALQSDHNPGQPTVSNAGAVAAEPRRSIRHAHLYLTRLDPWSVMKNAFMLSIAIAIILVVAVLILWSLLAASGTLDSLTQTINDVAGEGASAVDLAELFSFGRVLSIVLVVAALEVVLVSALATLFAYLYNLAVAITGGLQVTLTDDN